MNGFQGEYRGEPPVASPFARGMAFLGYGLLLLALPSAGTSALLAVILAYARRDGSGPLIASHHRFQIRIFWIGLALAAASAILAASAFSDAVRWPSAPLRIPVSPQAQTVAYIPGVDRPGSLPSPRIQSADLQVFTYHFGDTPLKWRPRALLEAYGSMILFALACLWSLGAPLYGALRLASGRPMGHSPG